MRPESGLLQIGRKLEKWQWHYNFLTWRNQQFFWRCFVSLVKFSYWSKFHVNIITGCEVMTIYFYKGWPEIWNLEILQSEFSPISGDWGKSEITHLARICLIQCYWMLQNVRFTALTVPKWKPTRGKNYPTLPLGRGWKQGPF